MADAGSSVDAGHEKQKSQHGELRATGVGMGQLDFLSAAPLIPLQHPSLHASNCYSPS